ncbi:MAG: DUF349 domain-containing protein [Bacteroidales bacterium]|nr:DUF349 domain-containing protein [Bacteroidales bacterium]
MDNHENLNLNEEIGNESSQGNVSGTSANKQEEHKTAKDVTNNVVKKDKATSTNISKSERKSDEFVILPEEDDSENIETQEDEIDDDTDVQGDEQNNIDYSSLSKEELLVVLNQLLREKPVSSIKRDVEEIKKHYYRLRNDEIESIKNKFIATGEDEINFEVPKDTDEAYFKELLEDYRKLRTDYAEALEKMKEDNLALKKEIIDKIGVLANGEESLNNTFNEFKELQQKWNEIGAVPHSESKDLWHSYNLQVERFYDYIKINKELRDLDFKKNLEYKIELCEKAESLMLEPNIVDAYKKLQEYHNKWREIGPVPLTNREEIWERFQVITREINKRHQEHFIKIKEEREMNLKQKEVLCQQAEAILKMERNSFKDWNEQTRQILDLQKMWKSIGMVPASLNTPIYTRFRESCNKFFEEKKEYFLKIREEQNNNLQLKLDLCVQAESMQNSTDWKKTTDAFLKLQKKWKTIGTVPQKQNDVIWKRFRAACNHFFEAKSEFFKNRQDELNENMIAKEKLISEIENYEPSDDHAKNVEKIKEFQNKWTEIGFVAFKVKEKLQKDYREAIDQLYKKLNMSKDVVDITKYRERMDIYAEGKELEKLRKERSYIIQKMKTIENDIALWENNLSFFSGSAGDLLKDVKKKLEKAHEELDNLAEKKKIIDLTERDVKKQIKEEKDDNDK